MDCRKAFCLWVGLSVGVAGCTNNSTLPLAPETPPPGTAIRKAAELPKRKLQPSTCVAIADLHAQEATVATRPEAERSGLRDKARAAYQEALDLNPNFLPAHLGLARLYRDANDHDRAVATYRHATKVHPREVTVWLELGQCQTKKKEWEPAIESLRRAQEIEPENRGVNQALSLSLTALGRRDEALACLRRSYAEPEAQCNLARLLAALNQPALARQHLVLALQGNPQLQSAQQLMARLNGEAAAPAPVAAQPAPQETARPTPSVKPVANLSTRSR